jgi:hypothetical protein
LAKEGIASGFHADRSLPLDSDLLRAAFARFPLESRDGDFALTLLHRPFEFQLQLAQQMRGFLDQFGTSEKFRKRRLRIHSGLKR